MHIKSQTESLPQIKKRSLRQHFPVIDGPHIGMNPIAQNMQDITEESGATQDGTYATIVTQIAENLQINQTNVG